MKIRTLGIGALLILILFTAFLIRIQGTPLIPEGQFTCIDAYFYYWQAQIVSEHGHLPERDMHRWLPLGRDLGQTLNLYGYILAYTHKTVALIFPNITVYQVALYMPVVCFCIGLGIFCLFLARTFGLLSAGVVGVLLVTFPGTIDRSTAGFGDRDAWCLMLGILTVTTYLASLQTHSSRKRYLWTLVSGFSAFLGGISWEGFGVFLSIILCIEIWRFLTTEKEEGLALYVLWVCLFIPTLYLASPAYRSGYGFATHLSAFVLMPPLILLGLRVLRYFLIVKSEKLRSHSRTLALCLTLGSLVITLIYVFIHRNTFADTTVPLSQNMLMQTVVELENTFLMYWMTRYGSVFVLGGLGAIMLILRFWKKQGLVFAAPLALFTITTFYRDVLDYFSNETVGNILFGVAIATCSIGFLLLAWKHQRTVENENTYIAFIVWLIFWVALTRDARRYDFFIGMSIAFFTADLIRFLADFYGNQVKQRLPRHLLKTAIPGITLTLILFWIPVGGHAQRTLSAATKMRRAIPGKNFIEHSFSWMKDNLPHTAVVAANWSFGSMLNVLAGVKTIIDQDHYIQHWIHLYNQYVHNATNVREALEFLKTHGATHLMSLQKQPPKVFLHGDGSQAFVPIYPTENFAEASVKIWEIRYPPEIQPHPKYIETGIPEIDTDLQP